MVIENSVKEVPSTQNDEEIILSVEGVSKKFCRDLKKSLWYGLTDIAGEIFGQSREKKEELRPREFWALQDVSLELHKGEAIGLLGPNGSGKTTLLRIIAGLIKPDSGKVTIKGRIAPLLAAGVGFNPILTGRENIYANMSILGLSKKEIDDCFEEVVEFAEIPHAIESPVQSYSSGMKARLGFACAIHVKPEILLLDEVLAVGDIKFKGKCTRKLAQLRQEGASIILVTHKTAAVLSVCEKASYLSYGKIIDYGKAESVIQRYEEDLMYKDISFAQGKYLLPEKPPEESLGVDMTYLCFRNQEDNLVDIPKSGSYTKLCIGCKVHREVKEMICGLSVKDITDMETGYVFRQVSSLDGVFFHLKPGEVEIQIIMFPLGLRPGAYELAITIELCPLPNRLDAVTGFKFKVDNPMGKKTMVEGDMFFQAREWQQTEINVKEHNY